MTKQEFTNRYQELQAKMDKVKTWKSKEKYCKMQLDLSNEYRVSNGEKALY
jgi:hypothetical protein